MVLVIHASLVHLFTMIDTAAWLFPTVALFGVFVFSVFVYYSVIKHPLGDLEGLPTLALSSMRLNQGM